MERMISLSFPRGSYTACGTGDLLYFLRICYFGCGVMSDWSTMIVSRGESAHLRAIVFLPGRSGAFPGSVRIPIFLSLDQCGRGSRKLVPGSSVSWMGKEGLNETRRGFTKFQGARSGKRRGREIFVRLP